MKCLVNGGLNLSERDGWWAEAYRPGVGWAIGDGKEHGNDPRWDVEEAEQIYQLLEEQVIPCFYDRDASGIPRAWLALMRTSMAELTPRFSTNRMLREYVGLYLSAAANYRRRIAGKNHNAKDLYRWHHSLKKNWQQVHFGNLETYTEDGNHSFKIPVYFGDIEPDSISVQIYAEPIGSESPEIHHLDQGRVLKCAGNGYRYSLRIPARRPVTDYTPRIIPFHESAAVPLEAAQIRWYE